MSYAQQQWKREFDGQVRALVQAAFDKGRGVQAAHDTDSADRRKREERYADARGQHVTQYAAELRDWCMSNSYPAECEVAA